MDEKIHELRSYLSLSLKAFGEPLGYTGTHIGRFEKSIATPDERLIQKICQVFSVDPTYFTGELSVEQAVQKKDVNLSSVSAHRLRDARLEKNLSMWELSRRSGVSQPQISLLESGKFQLKRKAGEKLAEALNVGVDWLLYGGERKRHFPADKKLIDWLWEHPEIREKLWMEMQKNQE